MHPHFIIGYRFFCVYFAIGLTPLTTYATIQLIMKLNIFTKETRKTVRSISDYKQDALVRQGAEQFKKLLEKGIRIPVVLL